MCIRDRILDLRKELKIPHKLSEVIETKKIDEAQLELSKLGPEFFEDYKYLYLPVYINLLIVLIGITFNAKYQLFIDETFLILGIKPIFFTLYGLFFGYSSLWLINFMFKVIKKRDGIGGGDFILFGGIGSIHGPIALPAILFIGSFLGCLYFIFSKKAVNSELPFGSFLILSSFIYFVLNLMNFSFVNWSYI